MTKLNKIFSIIFGVLIFTFIIHIGSTLTRKVKIDFSEEHLYTLSSGSKKILSKIGQPLKMKLYYSKTAANKGSEGIREFNNYFRYVNDLLEEYVDNSHNQITLQVIDPRPDTVEEEEALAHGLKKFNITETESYIFGLVLINESGGESAIEFFNPQEQENLEYEITKLIYKSQHQSKKTLGILSSLNVVNDDISPYVAQMMRMQGRTPEESWIIIQQLKDFYNVKKIDLNAHEINGVDLLLVVHPKNFSDQTQFAIDQFVLKGKPVVLLIDPFAMVDSVGAQNDASSNLEALMSKWNVKMESHIFAGDKYLSAAGRVSPDAPPQRLIALVNCDQRCTSPYKDVISSSLNSNLFIYPGALNVIDKKITNINITPIISTTDKGNTYRAQQQMLRNPVALWDLFHEGSEPIYMGLKIQGHFKSAFPNGIEISTKQDEKEIKQQISSLGESQSDGVVVVFSDVDFIHDQFAYKRNLFGLSLANDNATLLLNTLEAVSGDKDLLTVRSKGRFTRSFDVIDQIEFSAEKRTQQKVSQINQSIRRFEAELNDLGKNANNENVALLRNEGINKKKDLAKKITELKRELREVKRKGREQIEILGKRLQYANTLLVPFLLIIFGIYFNRKRKKQ